MSTAASFFGPRPVESLIQVALGREKADLAVVNARLLNVYTGELRDGCSVTVKEGWIAYVGETPQPAIGPHTTVIDAAGRTLIPGLIDGHTHLAWLFSVAEFLDAAMKGGTTTIITETMETYPVMGCRGVSDFLDSCADQPIKILATAPAMASISSACLGISKEDLETLLARDDILGLGESYWQTVLQQPQSMLPALARTLELGKRLEGHSAGARGGKLNAYLATGVSSCHEPIKAEEVLERLRLGLCVMAREGSIRRDLKHIAEIVGRGVDLRRLTLVTDGITPGELLAKGYMEHVVQKAIDCGFPPVSAVQMATLNAAEHFGLDGYIGGVAPGRQADLVLVPDPHTIDARLVVSKGRVIAEEGRLLARARRHSYDPASRRSIRLAGDLRAGDFALPVPDGSTRHDVRVIELVTDLVTRETIVSLPVIDGEIRCDTAGGIIKVAAVDRTHSPGNRFVGLLKGFGLGRGAMASSAAWDSSDIIVAGAEEGDMALAVNRIRELQGGAVVCAGNRIVAELPLPVMGMISALPLPELADRVESLAAAAAELGVPYPDPLLTLVTLTGAAIPYLRICEEGLVNLKDGGRRGLLADALA
jgi:adenine deaminase